MAGRRSQPSAALSASPRVIAPFDSDWRFAVGENSGAERPDFGDANWRTVTLPHDWSIAGPFDPNNPMGGAGAFLPSGIAWYRKTFTLPASTENRRVFVDFDGVMQNSDVWINGVHLGHRPYGYVSFEYELTPHLRYGPQAANVIVVRADTSQQPASRWYSGGGIYRHVRLITTNPVHFEHDSVFISTRLQLEPTPGSQNRREHLVQVQARVVNDAPTPQHLAVHVTLIDPTGNLAAEGSTSARDVQPGETLPIEWTATLSRPVAWDVNHPRLYRAEVAVQGGGRTLDAESVPFGIRDAVFDSQRGFLLNGRPLKLLGVCLHHDGGAFGAAVPLAVWEQRLATLRTLGVNAIRTAHNPPDPGFLDLCDRMGFLVMDELFDCWTVGKNPYDYHLYFDEWSKTDVRDTVRRDRNHPSIVLYSAGNEIHDTPQEEKAKKILAGLVDVFHENDPTRPVTQALFRPNTSHDYMNGLADLLDVIGTNYRDQELLAAWAAKPGRKIIGTEQRHDRETWLTLRDHPQEAGQFLWTGVDYLGESRRWPVIGASSGLLDRTGAVKPIGRERQGWWSPTPMVAIVRRVAPNFRSQYDPGYEPANAPTQVRRPQVLFADWTPVNSQPHDETVEVYSNAESVELLLNGQSLGTKPINANAAPRMWKVAYAPGMLVAVARNRGREVARDELRTAGAPAKIVLAADRGGVSTNWEDVVRVTATIVDANGTRVPNANNVVTFATEGPGAVVAVDNGDPATHEPFQATQHTAYQGTCVAFVRATANHGPFVIRATADGLRSGEATLQAE